LAIFHYDAIIFWTLGGVGIYFADKFIISRNIVRLSGIEVCDSAKIIAIDLILPFDYHLENFPLQYYFLRFPKISVEWHPFSVASFDSDLKILRFYIKCVQGGWTDTVFTEGFKKAKEDTFGEVLDYAHIQGPIGYKFEVDEILQSSADLILIAGGSGIVPFFELLKEIVLFDVGKRRRVKLIWLSKTHSEVVFLGQQLKTFYDHGEIDLVIDIYETQETPADSDHIFEKVEVSMSSASMDRIASISSGKQILHFRSVILILLVLIAVIFSSYVSNALKENHISNGALNVNMGIFVLLFLFLVSMIYSLAIRFFIKAKELPLISSSSSYSSAYLEPIKNTLSLNLPVKFGRPNFDKILREAQNDYDFDDPTLILCSGPNGLLEAVEKSSKIMKNAIFQRISFEF
jgi:NAD(P)H-flavin reductase